MSLRSVANYFVPVFLSFFSCLAESSEVIVYTNQFVDSVTVHLKNVAIVDLVLDHAEGKEERRRVWKRKLPVGVGVQDVSAIGNNGKKIGYKGEIPEKSGNNSGSTSDEFKGEEEQNDSESHAELAPNISDPCGEDGLGSVLRSCDANEVGLPDENGEEEKVQPSPQPIPVSPQPEPDPSVSDPCGEDGLGSVLGGCDANEVDPADENREEEKLRPIPQPTPVLPQPDPEVSDSCGDDGFGSVLGDCNASENGVDKGPPIPVKPSVVSSTFTQKLQIDEMFSVEIVINVAVSDVQLDITFPSEKHNLTPDATGKIWRWSGKLNREGISKVNYYRPLSVILNTKDGSKSRHKIGKTTVLPVPEIDDEPVIDAFSLSSAECELPCEYMINYQFRDDHPLSNAVVLQSSDKSGGYQRFRSISLSKPIKRNGYYLYDGKIKIFQRNGLKYHRYKLHVTDSSGQDRTEKSSKINFTQPSVRVIDTKYSKRSVLDRDEFSIVIELSHPVEAAVIDFRNPSKKDAMRMIDGSGKRWKYSGKMDAGTRDDYVRRIYAVARVGGENRSLGKVGDIKVVPNKVGCTPRLIYVNDQKGSDEGYKLIKFRLRNSSRSCAADNYRLAIHSIRKSKNDQRGGMKSLLDKCFDVKFNKFSIAPGDVGNAIIAYKRESNLPFCKWSYMEFSILNNNGIDIHESGMRRLNNE